LHFVPASVEELRPNPPPHPVTTFLVPYAPHVFAESSALHPLSVSGRREVARRSSPPEAKRIAVSASDQSPAIAVEKKSLPQTSPPGLVLPPTAASTISVKPELPIAPAVPVANLDPVSRRAISFSFPPFEAKVGRDPLGSLEQVGSLPKEGTGRAPTPNGAYDLSTKTPRSTGSQRQQLEQTTFTRPHISFMPQSEYPVAALKDKTEGDVIVKVTFAKSGHVVFRSFVRQVKNEELNTFARETVERIAFAPATRDGLAVDQDAVVTVTFRLSQLALTASF